VHAALHEGSKKGAAIVKLIGSRMRGQSFSRYIESSREEGNVVVAAVLKNLQESAVET